MVSSIEPDTAQFLCAGVKMAGVKVCMYMCVLSICAIFFYAKQLCINMSSISTELIIDRYNLAARYCIATHMTKLELNVSQRHAML